MRLKYLLEGLCYPSTIKWYVGEIEDRFFLMEFKYNFSEIKALIKDLDDITIVSQFKLIDDYTYEITIH